MLKGNGSLIRGADFKKNPVLLYLQKGSIGWAVTNLSVDYPLDERSRGLGLDVVDIGRKDCMRMPVSEVRKVLIERLDTHAVKKLSASRLTLGQAHCLLDNVRSKLTPIVNNILNSSQPPLNRWKRRGHDFGNPCEDFGSIGVAVSIGIVG